MPSDYRVLSGQLASGGAWDPSTGLHSSVAGALGTGPGEPAPGRGINICGKTGGVCGGICIMLSKVGRLTSTACCASTAEESWLETCTLPTRW